MHEDDDDDDKKEEEKEEEEEDDDDDDDDDDDNDCCNTIDCSSDWHVVSGWMKEDATVNGQFSFQKCKSERLDNKY